MRINSNHVSYCVVCQHVTDSRTDTCECGEVGALVPLRRLIDPDPFLGKIELIVLESFKVRPKSIPDFYRPEKYGEEKEVTTKLG